MAACPPGQAGLSACAARQAQRRISILKDSSFRFACPDGQTGSIQNDNFTLLIINDL